MLLRVFLIVAILAGAGVIAVTHFMVKPKVQEIIDRRNEYEGNWKKELSRANKLQADLKVTKATLDETQKNLEQTQTELAATKTQADNEKKRADDLSQKLATTSEELKTTQQDLAAWRALGIPVENVAGLISREKQLAAENEVLTEEKRIIMAANQKLKEELDRYFEPDRPVPLPAGLNGRIIAVDPRYDFVVLNIGEKQGVKENGVMLVSRDSKLVAKVRITGVQPDRCIANIVPGWKLDEVMEGDLVVY